MVRSTQSTGGGLIWKPGLGFVFFERGGGDLHGLSVSAILVMGIHERLYTTRISGTYELSRSWLAIDHILDGTEALLRYEWC